MDKKSILTGIIVVVCVTIIYFIGYGLMNLIQDNTRISYSVGVILAIINIGFICDFAEAMAYQLVNDDDNNQDNQNEGD